MGWLASSFVATASDTHVFRLKSTLKGSTFADGVQQLKISSDPSSVLLGENAGSTVLAVAIDDTECLMMGINPRLRLVAFSGNSIVAPLVEFENVFPIFIGDSQVILQAQGFAGSGVEAADLDALISLQFEPCVAMDTPTTPTRVDIRPLGVVRPSGPVGFDTPLFPDFGELEIVSDDPARPSLFVPLAGRPTAETTDCDLHINPTALNFGSVEIGSNAVLQLQIRNNGQTPCTVSNIVQSGSTAFLLTGPTAFSLAPGDSVTLDVSFAPFVLGTDSAVLRVTSSDPDAPQQFINLTGTGTLEILECQLSASPLALNFGAVEVGTNKTLEITVSNSGGLDCVVDRALPVGHPGYTSSPAAPFTVPAHTSVVVSVTFTPLQTGQARGTFQINSFGADGTGTNLTQISLTATGITAQCRLEIEPDALDFGAVALSTNRSLTVNIANVGITNCTITDLIISNDAFALVSAPVTPFEIPVGADIDLTVDFMPTETGTTNGTLFIVSDNPVMTNSVPLTGFGVDAVAGCAIVSSRSSFDFGTVTVGKTNILKATISNPGAAPCTIESISLVGSNDLALIAPHTPANLPPNASLEVAIRYSPTGVGMTGGELRIVSTDELQTVQTFPISGLGVLVRCELSVTSTNLNFGALPVGDSETLTVTLSNTNTIDCSVSSIQILGGNGAYALDPIVPRTRFALRPGESIDLPVTFTALSQGTNNATLRIESDDSVDPVLVSLTGVGLRCNLTVSPTSLNFGEVTLHGTNTMTLTLGNTGNMDCVVEEFLVTGSGRFVVVSPAPPFPVAPGAQVPVEVEYRPELLQTIIIESGNLRSTGNAVVLP